MTYAISYLRDNARDVSYLDDRSFIVAWRELVLRKKGTSSSQPRDTQLFLRIRDECGLVESLERSRAPILFPTIDLYLFPACRGRQKRKTTVPPPAWKRRYALIRPAGSGRTWPECRNRRFCIIASHSPYLSLPLFSLPLCFSLFLYVSRFFSFFAPRVPARTKASARAPVPSSRPRALIVERATGNSGRKSLCRSTTCSSFLKPIGHFSFSLNEEILFPISRPGISFVCILSETWKKRFRIVRRRCRPR